MPNPLKKESIIDLLKDDNYLIGALLALYNCQTFDEQNSETTKHANNIGFNALDAPILTDIAKFYLKRNFLSPKQIVFVRTTLHKYSNQLSLLEIIPVKSNGNNQSQKTKIKKQVIDQDGFLKITFPFSHDTLTEVKNLEGRWWNGEEKYWGAAPLPSNIERLKELGFEIEQKILSQYEKEIAPPEEIKLAGFGKPLYPFQNEGLSFIESKNGRVLIGDEMGLGKTIQALAWLYHKKAFPAVIVVPASLKINWKKEITECGLKVPVQILSGKTPEPINTNQKILIINYDILESWTAELQKLNLKTLIIDESHYCKNIKAKRTKAIRQLAKGIDNIIALTGTPIVNRPAEFFPVLNLLRPEIFSNFWNFTKEYCGRVQKTIWKKGKDGIPRPLTIWDFSGSTNTEKLHRLLTETVMIRRLKSEVLPDLPAKVRSIIPIATISDEYRKAEEDFIGWLKKKKGEKVAKKAVFAEALVKIEKLKQLAVEDKLKSSIDWIKDFLESGEKLVVFATHKNVIDKLIKTFKNIAVKVDGSVTGEKRNKAVKKFNGDDSVRLFIGNIKAAGIGLNLHTACSNVCFLEIGWTPADHDQAEDRVHRIGQEAESINIWYLLTTGSIEENIIELIDKKRQVLSEVLDGKEVDSDSILSELLNKIGE